MPLSLLNHSALALFAQRTRDPTSARSIGFCAIWVCISSSSSSLLLLLAVKRTSLAYDSFRANCRPGDTYGPVVGSLRVAVLGSIYSSMRLSRISPLLSEGLLLPYISFEKKAFAIYLVKPDMLLWRAMWAFTPPSRTMALAVLPASSSGHSTLSRVSSKEFTCASACTHQKRQQRDDERGWSWAHVQYRTRSTDVRGPSTHNHYFLPFQPSAM